MVSACLLGENCKYNGKNNASTELRRILEGHEVIPICPEVMGGLSTPRASAEIVGAYVINKMGEDVTQQFQLGAQLTLKLAKEIQPYLIILQSRSPSCGVGEIYDGTFSGNRIPGDGITTALLKNNGFQVIDVIEFIHREEKVR